MITRSEFLRARQKAAKMLASIGVSLRSEELDRIDVVDFGLGELEQSGVQILTLVDLALDRESRRLRDARRQIRPTMTA